jgi:amino acid transporter
MTPEGNHSPHLIRHFGTLQATALNMSNMIGIGPFLTIPLLMSALSGPQSMLGWLVAVLIVINDGMIWSELGAALPGSGGSYVYPLPSLLAFLGWLFIYVTLPQKVILFSLIALMAGLVSFVFWSKNNAKWPFQSAATIPNR